MDEHDYLTFHLYVASKTPRIKKTRTQNWIWVTVAFFSLGFLFFVNDNDGLTVYFLALGILSLFLYPFYSRWKYKNHYLKFVRETYKNRFGLESEFIFEDDFIGAKDRTGEVKINKSEVEQIDEIKGYYFVKARTGMVIMISKTKTPEIEAIKRQLQVMSEKFGIKRNTELDWKWR